MSETPVPSRPRTRRRWIRAITILLALLLVPLLLLWIFQRRLVFQPDTSRPGPAAEYVPGSTDVTLHTADGLDLTAWYRPPMGDCATTILIAPGNAGNRAGRTELIANLSREGFGVLLLEYRGYGGNPGSPTEQGLAMDAEAAWQFLNPQRGQAVIFFGESLGGGVVSALALKHPPAATILRSPFVDLPAAGQESYPIVPVRLLLKDQFPVRDNVSRSAIPLTVIYGDKDGLIPPEQSLEVAHAAGGPVSIVSIAGADHNDAALVHGPAVVEAVRAAAGNSCGG